MEYVRKSRVSKTGGTLYVSIYKELKELGAALGSKVLVRFSPEKKRIVIELEGEAT